MQRRFSVLYVIGFSAAVCFVCSLLVSATAVGLRQRQQENQTLDRSRNVLAVAGILSPGQKATREEILRLFDENIEPVVVELATGEETDIDWHTFDQRQATADPQRSRRAPANDAGIQRLPDHAVVYKLVKDGRVEEIILPVEGKGLWSTLYGFLALRSDGRTIAGITFYQHGETPGLGGEVDNQKWKGLWIDRLAFDEDWSPAIEVIKGQAGPPQKDPHQVDGLSGATITSRGVSHFVRFWLGEHGFGPYLKNLRESGVLHGG